MIQNVAARLVFNKPKRAYVTPLFVSLHWLPVAARIQFKTLMLAYRTTTGSAFAYFHSLLWIYIPSRSLRSASDASWDHHREAQNHSPEHSRSFYINIYAFSRCFYPKRLTVHSGYTCIFVSMSFTVPGWWNYLPTPIRNADFILNTWLHPKLIYIYI